MIENLTLPKRIESKFLKAGLPISKESLELLLNFYIRGKALDATELEINSIKQYVEEELEFSTYKSYFEKFSTLYADYIDYCIFNGIRTVGKKTFSKYLESTYRVTSRYSTGNTKTIFGLKIRSKT